MGKRQDTTPTKVTQARIDWLYAEMRSVKSSLRDAKNDGSHSAVAALHRQLQSLRGELDAEKLRQAEQMAEDRDKLDAADMTPEEWIDYHAGVANQLEAPELEPYVQAWARQHGAVIVMEGGFAQLRYRQTG